MLFFCSSLAQCLWGNFVFVHSFRCFVRINNWRFHNFSGKMKEHRSWFHISKVSLIVCLSLDLDFLAYFSDSIKVSIGNDVIETYWICCAVWFGSVCVVCLKLNLIQVSKSDLILLCFVQLIHVWLLFLNIRSESLCSDSFCGWSIISLCIFQKKLHINRFNKLFIVFVNWIWETNQFCKFAAMSCGTVRKVTRKDVKVVSFLLQLSKRIVFWVYPKGSMLMCAG